MPPPLLEVSNLTKRYGDLLAVDDVSFRIDAGEILVLLGPNGSGKTTILRAVGATLRIDSGRVRIAGHDVAREPREAKSRLGVVHQDDTLDPDLSVRENLLVHASYFDTPRRDAVARADELLDRFDLTRFCDFSISQLSGGLRRRLMLARAFFHASVLVLDEPTTGLDPEARLRLWGDIRDLLPDGVAVILTSHDMEEAERLGDRVLLMERGRIRADGTPAELIAKTTLGKVHEIRLAVGQLEKAVSFADELRKLISGEERSRVIRHGGFLFCETHGTDDLRRWAAERGLALTERPANLADVYLSVTGEKLAG